MRRPDRKPVDIPEWCDAVGAPWWHESGDPVAGVRVWSCAVDIWEEHTGIPYYELISDGRPSLVDCERPPEWVLKAAREAAERELNEQNNGGC